jgi:NitT/TauT family transport system ATP-binding protein
MTHEFAQTSILHLEDIQQRYGALTVLTDIDLSIGEGELVTMLGPSGSGKSTLFRIIIGEEAPTNGVALIDNKPIILPSVNVGIVPQDYRLAAHLSAVENVMLPRFLTTPFKKWYFGGGKKAARKEALRFLERVGLMDHHYKWPKDLSGGQRQRVAVAQALITKPRILLMDEPFGALDHEARRRAQVFLLELWEKYNLTILFVTHDIEEALYLGTRLTVISQHHNRREQGAVVKVDIPVSFPLTTDVKHSSGFLETKEYLRKEVRGTNADKSITAFNLQHKNSFQTLTDVENQ